MTNPKYYSISFLLLSTLGWFDISVAFTAPPASTTTTTTRVGKQQPKQPRGYLSDGSIRHTKQVASTSRIIRPSQSTVQHRFLPLSSLYQSVLEEDTSSHPEDTEIPEPPPPINQPTTTTTTVTGATPSTTSAATTNTEYSFFDEAIVYVRAGAGGQGASTFRKGVGGQNGPPDGGNGGRGGNVILEMDASLNTLAGLNPQALRPNAFGGSGAATSSKHNNSPNYYSSSFVRTFRAEPGQEGDRNYKSGRYGQHVTVRLPPGTVVQELVTTTLANGTQVVTKRDLGTLSPDHPTLVVAHGGEGGEGSGVGGKGRGVRRKRISPEGGEKKTIQLTLKIVADVALVGTPNAGKSTFLAAVTRAKPKIANVRT